ncbi:nuclear body protein SP140-like isoform X2 [Peromyscus californicus insignis]|uniref:nuclear body protein SP140-like isoform X2 n=1 Tax=Peromyscus californicus insignis TaxID=564181 RepID=UPI0022A6F25B|nr:nuclear body protein SP140-like isoform X2 [Peromyscus californicus insignis]
MAGGDNGSSSRATTEDQSKEESAEYQRMFKHFKENKVEIASAITKPFPFLMSLRDRGFISEQKFRDSQERCQNLVPVGIVVYDILSDLQNKFSLSLLAVIFSKVHLKAYPDLEETRRSFLDVSNSHRTPQRMNGRDVEERPRLPGHVREGTFFPNGCRRNIRSTEASCSPGNSQMNDEQGEEVPSLPQCNGGEGSSSCEQMFDGQEPQDDLPPSSLRPEAGAEQSTSGNEACSCVMCSPAYIQEGPEARMGSSRAGATCSWMTLLCQGPRKDTVKCDPTAGEEERVQTNYSQPNTVKTGNNTTVGKSKRKRRKKKGHNWSRVKWRRPQTVRPTIPRKRRYENADFSTELLPVTCGDVKGVLSKDKFKQGVSVKSIQSEDGNWYTPPEFEILGGHEKSRNWRLSLRCYDRPLKLLIEGNFLPNPPRIYGRKKKRTQNLYSSPADPCMQNSDECEVCRDVGTLFCCDTCSRAFHEECHIPTVEAEITPWSCIFCRMQSLGSQQSHPESEVLQRRMVPQEQLKCEFVLLKVYCCSESSFFSKMPYYYYFRETSEGVQKAMWLDIIKKKLRKRGYSHVEEFVQDMRLIFHNHRTTFKDLNFGQMGLGLESEFEKTFKEVFAIQDTNENS